MEGKDTNVTTKAMTAEELEKKLTDTYGYGSKVPIMELRKSEDAGIREIADYVYQNIFLYYTMKQ